MKKIDFAIHLLSAARGTLGGETKHIATTALLVMLECSRRGVGKWHDGPDIARTLGIPPNRMTGTCRAARALGYLETFKRQRGANPTRNDSLDWRVTAKGQRVVARILDTSALTKTPALAQ